MALSTRRVRPYDGSIEPFSAERHAFREKQPLKSLPLVQRCLDPEIGRAREHALGEVQNSLNVELFELEP